MSRFSSSSHPSSAPFDEAAEAREYEAFFRQQDPVLLAAVDWHTRWEQGLSAAEQAELEQWLSADPAHAAAYARLDDSILALQSAPAQQTQHLVQGHSPSPEYVAQKAARPQKSGNAKGGWLSRFGLSTRRNWLAFCCAALVAVGVGWHHWSQDQLFSAQYAVQRGQNQTITLPDGSELVLDAKTQAKVTFYSDRREVRLQEGQVMFSVAPASDQPLHVLAGPARVTVVGTRFSVRYSQTGIDADTVKVSVEEGHVQVADVEGWFNKDAGSQIDLLAGQSVSITAKGLMGEVIDIAPGSVALWRKGLVRFENTPLADALAELERYGPTGLVVLDPTVAAMPIGGSFQVTRPKEFARMITQILPVKLVPGKAGQSEIALRR